MFKCIKLMGNKHGSIDKYRITNGKQDAGSSKEYRTVNTRSSQIKEDAGNSPQNKTSQTINTQQAAAGPSAITAAPTNSAPPAIRG